MSVKDAVVIRFKQICRERNMKINELAVLSGVTPSTAYSMMDSSRRDVSIVTIKKFCDGLDISLGEFFDAEEFELLEQEIKWTRRSFGGRVHFIFRFPRERMVKHNDF